MLPMTMFGQTGDKVLNEMPSGQIKAIHTVLTSLPQKDSLRKEITKAVGEAYKQPVRI